MARRYKRSRRRRSRKSRGRRSSGRKSSYTNYVRRGTPIAPRTVATLKYVENLALAYLSGTANDYVFRLNSIFDPNSTGTGHQPFSHDTYQTLYNRYRVFACSWRITVPASSDTIQLAVVPNNTLSAYSNYTLAAESPRGISKAVGYASGTVTVIKGHISLPRLNGSTKAQYKADDRFQAQFGSNPVEDMGLHIVANIPGGSNVTIYPVVQLMYHCEFFDPLQLGQS